MRPVALLAAALLSAAPAGCALPPLDATRTALDAAARGYNATNAAATASKAAERAACLAPPAPAPDAPACIEGVIARWAGRSAAITALYAALEGARAALAFAEAMAASGRPVDAARLARAVEAVLVAAGALPAPPAPGGAVP